MGRFDPTGVIWFITTAHAIPAGLSIRLVCQHPGSISVDWTISSLPSESRECVIIELVPSSNWVRTRQISSPSFTSRIVQQRLVATRPVYSYAWSYLGVDLVVQTDSPSSNGSKYSCGVRLNSRTFCSPRTRYLMYTFMFAIPLRMKEQRPSYPMNSSGVHWGIMPMAAPSSRSLWTALRPVGP
jgi:hypothetical protein